ncbi:MAG: hypothetical protein COA99_01220 [Moraxellaceae bacterium]|nr:MAG: hypothetical protein COA99_01220 [Moraxellaceae bacterium]
MRFRYLKAFLNVHFFLCIFLIATNTSSIYAEQYKSAQQESEELNSAQLVSLLQQGGYVLYWRHAATDHQQKDAVEVIMQDCSTQRNLSEKGKQQAVDIGEHLLRLDIKFDRILSSPYCRCKETAELAFGHFETNDNLYFSIDADRASRKEQSRNLQQLLSTTPAIGKNHIIISHTANLKEAAGVWPKPEAVIHIFRPGQDIFYHLGKISPEEWTDL